jgi:hypothetical protein
MRLTWRDLVATLFMGAIIGIYTAYLRGADGWMISSTRGTAAGVLVLGAVGGCGLGRTEELYVRGRSSATVMYTVFATALGATALIAAVLALITANGAALAVLFGTTAALWLAATAHHAFAGYGQYALGPRTHEVIDRPHVHR